MFCIRHIWLEKVLASCGWMGLNTSQAMCHLLRCLLLTRLSSCSQLVNVTKVPFRYVWRRKGYRSCLKTLDVFWEFSSVQTSLWGRALAGSRSNNEISQNWTSPLTSVVSLSLCVWVCVSPFGPLGRSVPSAWSPVQLCETGYKSPSGLQPVLHQLQSRQTDHLRLPLPATWVCHSSVDPEGH